MQNAEEIVRNYIAKEILFSGKYNYSDDASFLDEGIVDSMNVLQIVMFIEKQFGIHVEDEEVVPDNFDSVAKLAAYVRGKAKYSAVQDQPEQTNLSGNLRLGKATPGK